MKKLVLVAAVLALVTVTPAHAFTVPEPSSFVQLAATKRTDVALQSSVPHGTSLGRRAGWLCVSRSTSRQSAIRYPQSLRKNPAIPLASQKRLVIMLAT